MRNFEDIEDDLGLLLSLLMLKAWTQGKGDNKLDTTVVKHAIAEIKKMLS